MTAPSVYVAISKPLPATTQLASLDVNARVTNVEIETQAGGFGACRVGLLAPDSIRPMIYPSLPQPVEVEDMAHVVVTIGGHVLHEGSVTRVAARRDGIESLGYGVRAGNWSALDVGTSDMAVTDRIASAALDAVPWFTLGEVPASTSRRMWSESQYMTAAQVIDTLCSEGSDGVPWLYHVYEDRVARIVAKTAPVFPTYRIAYDPATMDISWDYSEVADAVRATYQDSEGTPRVTAWVYRTAQASGGGGRGGGPVGDPENAYLRRVTLSGAGPAATQMQFLQTWIAEHGAPRLSGSINLADWRGLTLPGGVEVPGYIVRAGQWVELEGYGMAAITRTSSNLTTGATTIELDHPSPRSFKGLLARLQRTDTAIRSGRNVITGNRT